MAGAWLRQTEVRSVAALGAAIVLLPLLSLLAPVNHDESQYLAAAKLGSGAAPFLDFLHLQAPLQIYLLAPLASLAGTHAYISLRLVTALMGVAALVLVYRSQRLLQVEPRTALLGAALLALCHSFQFGTSVVRNDALPMLLEAAAVVCAIGALRGSGTRHLWLWAMAGLMLGLGVSAKISYLLPLAALALFHLLRLTRGRENGAWFAALASGAGAAIGLLPLLFARASAPEAFDYGVFEYGRQAPFDWYSLTDAAHRLSPAAKLADTAKALLAGPAAAVLAWLCYRRLRGPEGGRAGDAGLLVGLWIAAGLVAALLPTPTWLQYLIPMLPPLFVGFGLEMSRRPPGRAEHRVMVPALIVFAVVGLAQPVKWAAGTSDVVGPVEASREARWVGSRIRAAGLSGDIATLSPHMVLGSGFPLDRRFAAGPFFYRTGDRIRDELQRRLHAISPATTASFLNEKPPAAIVTGYESDSRGVDLDRPLRLFAEARGYAVEQSPYGRARLYLAPRPNGARGRIEGR